MVGAGWDDIASVDQLKFSHKMRVFTTKQFEVENMDGENILTIKESKRFKFPNGRLRPFKMDAIDREGNVLFRIKRKFHLFEKPRIELLDEVNRVIGTVEKDGKGSFCLATHDDSLKIIGNNAWRIKFFANAYYTIMTNDIDKDDIGEICKRFKGPASEKNSYKLIFPASLEVRLKALIISACVLIVSGLFISILRLLYAELVQRYFSSVFVLFGRWFCIIIF
jgi:hypothetical protein